MLCLNLHPNEGTCVRCHVAKSRVPSVRWQRLTPQLPGEDESELSWCPQPLTYSTPLHIKGALEWSQATPASQPDNNTPPPPHFHQFFLALSGTHLGPDNSRANLRSPASPWFRKGNVFCTIFKKTRRSLWMTESEDLGGV